MKTCPYCGTNYPDETGTCVVDQTPLELVAGAANGISSRAPICPACGQQGEVQPVVSPWGSFSLLVFLFGGLVAVLLHNMSRPKRGRCVRCEVVFSYSTRVSRAARVMLWVLFVPVVLGLILCLLHLALLFFAYG